MFAQWADTTLFWAAMAYNLQPRGAQALFLPPTRQCGAEAARPLGKTCPPDEHRHAAPAPARCHGGLPLVSAAPGARKSTISRLAPACVADFAAYHPAQCVPVMADIFQATPAVLEWMDRVAALGHGRMEKFSAADAITVAGAEPIPVVDDIFQDEHGIALGSRVTIAAESFGTRPTGAA